MYLYFYCLDIGYASSYGFLEFESSSDAEVSTISYYLKKSKRKNKVLILYLIKTFLFSRILSCIPEVSFYTCARLRFIYI